MAVITSTSKKRIAWIEYLDHCRGGVFVNQLFFGKTIGGVADVWVDAVVALEMAFRAGGYTPKSAWAYNFRGIGGAPCSCTAYTKCSLHGGQGAIDIDPKENPYISTSTFRWSDTDFTPEQIALVEGILNTKGEQLWFWGGRWSTIKDYMHFEPNVDPGSTEVDWTTVPGGEEEIVIVDLTQAQLDAINDMVTIQASRKGDDPKWGSGNWDIYQEEVWTGPDTSDPGPLNLVTHIQMAKVYATLRGKDEALQKAISLMQAGTGMTRPEVIELLKATELTPPA